MLKQVTDLIKEEALLPQGERVVVAVSGGPDSMALVHVLFTLREQFGWSLAVAHLNHLLRGEESDSEAEFVKRKARCWGLPFFTEEIDVESYRLQRGIGMEEAAREVRYDFLWRAARRFEAGRVALGHQLDDQVETVLMRILRGTGLKGLMGIPVQREKEGVIFVRPLLRITRCTIESYCRQENIPFFEDSSNRSMDITRNRLRLEVLPQLKEINPQVGEALLRLADQAAMDDQYMTETASQALQNCLHSWQTDLVRVRREVFLALPQALQSRVVKLILNRLTEAGSLSFIHIREVMRQIANGKNMHLPAGWKLYSGGEYILFSRSDAVKMAERPYTYPLPVPGLVHVPEAGMTIHACVAESGQSWQETADVPVTEVLDWSVYDLDCVPMPLWVRSRQPGDWMRPFGLNGRKKVKDIFIDAKWPVDVRNRTPLLAGGTFVLWIPGLRRSEEAPVTERTRHLLYLLSVRNNLGRMDCPKAH